MISDECKKAGLKALPVWDIGEQTVKLTFFSNSRIGGAVDGAVDGAISNENDGAIDGAIGGAFDGATKRALKKTIYSS